MSNARRPTALITGASRGLGAALALAFAQAGYNLILTARSLRTTAVRVPSRSPQAELPSDLPAVVAQAEALGAHCTALALDLLDEASIDRVIHDALASVTAAGGTLDLLVHNAVYQGADSQLPVLELDEAALLNSLRGNVLGPLRLTRGLLPALQQAQGLILCIVSGAGQADPPFSAARGGWGFAYGASKAALARLPGALRAELGDTGLQALSVNPGVVLTETALATLGAGSALEKLQGAWQPAQAAQALLWVAQHPAQALGQARQGVLDLQRAALARLKPSSE